MESDPRALETQQSSWSPSSESSRIWQHGTANHGWVFGLEWTATLGRRSRRWLFTQLRQQNVRWYASAGASGELIGISKASWLDEGMPSLGVAAVAYAQSRPDGSYLLCLTVDTARQWVVGVHQGKLIAHTDKWIEPEAFDPLRQALVQRFDDLVVEAVQWSDPSKEPPVELSFLQETAAHPARFQRLRPVMLSGANALLLLGAIICLLGAVWMWQSLSGRPVDRPWVDEQETLSVATLEPVVKVHAPADLLKLLQDLQQLPVNPAQWSLQGAQCELSNDTAHCSARYQRHQNNTDNDALARFIPANWHLKPVAMDETNLESRMRVNTQVVRPSASHALEAWLVTLQRQTAITPDLRLGSWRHQSVAQSPNPIRSREVTLRFPVRQWAVLRDWSLPVYWQSVALELVPDATIDEHHGYIMFHLKGELRAVQ